ncbi:Ig-like domain-containing protein [Anaerocolumna xylanovorans]|uniref:Ig-like domain (Group 2) n=1 Tax=Anaerocolumna xylanovorans DSM 12503 TaxID=1121345 RepID=A0A1M7YHE0_9FIRM|nr:Ig-like domain-containing protein [Anaerocolumna xylanovorans]SHO52023.1 Ig-like domain (group 2) [Anaerocolumna xylanovorans DSM 12503]
MKTNLWKKCLLAFGMFLFLTVLLPPVFGNTLVASASTIDENQSDIKLNVKSKSLVKESTFSLKLYNVTDSQKVSYKSGASSIATVDDTGLITAVDYGTAIITVTVKDGLKTVATLECEITVGPPALSVKLTKSELTLVAGDKTSLTAILKPNNTVEEARFWSNDSTIATVSVGGRVTAKSAGVTYVFVAIGNGKYDYCKVTVLEKADVTPTESAQ